VFLKRNILNALYSWVIFSLYIMSRIFKTSVEYRTEKIFPNVRLYVAKKQFLSFDFLSLLLYMQEKGKKNERREVVISNLSTLIRQYFCYRIPNKRTENIIHWLKWSWDRKSKEKKAHIYAYRLFLFFLIYSMFV
jgi:hypothetical protein